MRLFKSQKTRSDRAKLFINLNSANKLSVLSNLTRVTYSSPNESPDRGRKKVEAK